MDAGTSGPADDRPTVLLLDGHRPPVLADDIAARALLEGRARGLWTHIAGRARPLPSALALRELADVCSTVDLTLAEDWVRWVGAAVAAGSRFDVVFDLGARTQQAAAEVAATVGAQGNDPAMVRRLADRDRCRAALTAAGFPQPRFRLCSGEADVLDFVHGVPGPWIIKPRRSTGSGAARLVTRAAEVDSALARLPAGEQFLVEQFVAGPQYSAEGVFLDGHPLVLAVAEKQTEQWNPLRAVGHVLPADLPAGTLGEIERTVVAALRELGLSFGPFHVELCLTGAGAVLGGVHAHLGGGWIHVLLTYALPGLELCGLVYGDALGERPTPPSRVPRQSAAAHYLTAAPGWFVRAENWRAVLDHPAVMRAELAVEPGAPIDADDAGQVGVIIATAATAARARALVADLAATVRIVVDPHPPPTSGVVLPYGACAFDTDRAPQDREPHDRAPKDRAPQDAETPEERQ